MNKHSAFSLIVALTIIFPFKARAELWRCKLLDGKSPIVTSNPSSIEGRDCELFVLRSGSYTQLPADATLLHSLGKDMQAVSAPDSPPRRPKKRPTVVWHFEESSGAGASLLARSSELQCRVWGSVKGTEPGVGKLTIVRGGATQDHFRLILPAAGKVQRWDFKLSGPCRNPLVRIIPFH